ncbi:amino acid adenylation domain-containing protein [Embleya scabrispora]|nr:amino acid adenylation domain-containing protein [Embleya scabrispora]
MSAPDRDDTSRARHVAVVREINDVHTDYPREATVHELFARQAQRTPDAPAIVRGDRRLTYRELRSDVERLADRLVAEGVRPGDVVAVVLPRSIECVTAVLGVLSAGAAYLPLDPDYPERRLTQTLTDAEVRVAISDERHRASLDDLAEGPAVVDVHDLPESTGAARSVRVGPDDPAYVIYTSGSTGEPKGVVVSHRGQVRLVREGDPRLRLSSRDVLLATTNPTFDVSCFEMFAALLNGACLVVAEVDALLAADSLAEVLRAEHVTVMWLSAGLFHQMAMVRPAMFSGLRMLIAGGDALSPEAVRQVLAEGPPGALLNGYGPTENASLSTVHEITELAPDARTVPIGTPVANSTAYVLTSDGELADAGESGELWVGGDGVALEYLGRPKATEDHFVNDPFTPDATGRLYRTGDLARWREDGVLEFLGRRDRQVKVRGYRIELDEIEAHLTKHDHVREAAAVASHEGDRESLIAWVTAAEDADAGELPGELRDYLRDRLPEYMVPRPILVRSSLPLADSGKLDRRRLLREAQERAEADTAEGPDPRTPVEKTTAEVWSEVVGVETIGRDTDFFALGGNSLQATRVAAACRARFDLDPGHSRFLIRVLLDNPTLGAFAARVASLIEDPGQDTAEDAVDFEAEARLDPERRFPSAQEPPTTGRLVFLTGSTGFLGTYLLDALLDDGLAEKVVCLVRAPNEDRGRRRLAARMRRYGLDPTRLDERVTLVLGDLKQPRFGLDEAAFDALSESVDTILHAGSQVNFAYPYAALRESNVGGTRTVLDLASRGTAKILHYVSTIAVIAGFGVSGVDRVEEDEPLRFGDRISLGYPESKWVAERLVAQAAQQGLATAVYRPYEITGTTDEGIWNTDTMMCALFRSIAETGLAPDIPLPLDFVPVDYTARAIVHILARQAAWGHAYNIANPHDARLGALVERLRAMGYPIRTVSYDEWVSYMAALTARDPDQPMAPFMPMFLESAHDADISVKEMYFAGTFPDFGRANLDEALADSGLTCPPVDADLLDMYLRYFVSSGFLQPPDHPDRPHAR